MRGTEDRICRVVRTRCRTRLAIETQITPDTMLQPDRQQTSLQGYHRQQEGLKGGHLRLPASLSQGPADCPDQG